MIPFLKEIFSLMRWQDIIDILIIATIIYWLYTWLQGTRALRILLAFAALAIFYFMALWFGFFMTTWILQYLWAVILVIMVVVFQAEIRQVLEKISPLRFFLGRSEPFDKVVFEEIIRTLFDLAQNRIGAILVFQRSDLIEDYLKGGIPLDGRISYEVLSSIFQPKSPTHDGAVIIKGGRIVSVGCYLPLSDNPNLPRYYGTRHRAGLGITEKSDALSLIVSEERGEISLARNGHISLIYNPEELRERLMSLLLGEKRKKVWSSLITTNLAPKIGAAVLSLGLWGFIAGQQKTEMLFTIPLEYRNLPPNVEISGELVNRIEVGLRGPRGVITNVSADKIRAHVDLSQSSRGLNYIRLSTENITIPLGAEITKINPEIIRLRLEEVRTRAIEVKAKLVGKLPKPLRLKSVVIDPPSVILQGPESLLKKVKGVFTEPVDLSQINGDTKILVTIDVDVPQIRLAAEQPAKVSVEIKVEKPI